MILAFFRARSIGFRIAFIGLLPFLAALLFAGNMAFEYAAISGEAQRVQSDLNRSQQVSALIHQLQKERGMSAAYIGSNGRRFLSALSQQHEITDARIRKLEGEQEAALDRSNQKEIIPTLNRLGQRQTERALVLNQERTALEATAFYSELIAELLQTVDALSAKETDKEILEQLVAYSALLEAKERAGLERAMGATGFSAGEFDAAIYQRFVQLNAEQESYFDVFSNHASPSQLDALDRALASDKAKSVEAMRQLALVEPFASRVDETNPEVWWEDATARVDLLKEVEDLVALELVQLAAQNAASADRNFWWSIALILTIGSAVAALSTMVIVSIIRPIREVSELTERMMAGDFDHPVIAPKANDEIGVLQRRILAFSYDLAAAKRQRAQQETDRKTSEADREKRNLERDEEARKIAERSQVVDLLTQSFETDMAEALDSFAKAMETLTNTAGILDNEAINNEGYSSVVASASTQTNQSVQEVAEAAKRMSISINEVVGQIATSAKESDEAVQIARATKSKMDQLSDAAQKIESVVNLIKSIAQTTNMLALNATIEAARGETRGEGMAVVAKEVRSLAIRASEATDAVVRSVADVQTAVRESSLGMDQIAHTLEKLDAIGDEVSKDIEQHGETVRLIAQNIHEAANAVNDVDANIVEIERSSCHSRERVREMLQTATDFSQHSEKVRLAVSEFLTNIKAV